MREIVLDTETTGFEPSEGHRLLEIGCVELINHMPTGETYHVYINPQRDVPEDAFRVHGLSTEFLQDKPLFADVVDSFLEFIGTDQLIIHNAAFDMKFLNAELALINRPVLPMTQALDTVAMARRKYPGAPASLDALCRRFNIDNSHREKHGALLDSELLAEVYLELRGGREPGLALLGKKAGDADDRVRIERPFREARPHAASAEEIAVHRVFLKEKVKNSVWLMEPEAAPSE